MSWAGRRVLVTGAGGFIGSHLTERLVELGATTRAFVHYRGNGSWGWLDESAVKEHCEVLAGDIRDRDMVRRAVREVDVVFHLAALIAIPYSYHAPASYIDTNVTGTLNVLQEALDAGVERIVHTSTSEVYGTAQAVPISERHPLRAQSPYAASKSAADQFVEAFGRSYGLRSVIVRPFNTFGPRQSTRAIIPTIISQCLGALCAVRAQDTSAATIGRLGGSTLRLGNLSPTRDLNFVSNTVEGFVLAGAAPEAIGRTLNLGSGTEVSIGELARRIADAAEARVEIVQDPERVRPQGSEVERLVADASAARTVLGWQPRVGLEEGLRLTIDWMRQRLEAYRVGVYAL